MIMARKLPNIQIAWNRDVKGSFGPSEGEGGKGQHKNHDVHIGVIRIVKFTILVKGLYRGANLVSFLFVHCLNIAVNQGFTYSSNLTHLYKPMGFTFLMIEACLKGHQPSVSQLIILFFFYKNQRHSLQKF